MHDAYHYTTPDIAPVGNFYLKVRSRVAAGTESEARYEVLFRQQGDDFYTFRIEDGKNYRVRLNANDISQVET
jgi:hypothetical protein